MSYDFSGLTPKQQALLTFQGWCVEDKGWSQPSKRTVHKLIERGLLIEHQRKIPSRLGEMTVLEYEVPLDVHMAWCEHCSKKEMG